MRILLTEDDIELAETTAKNLKRSGFAVDIAHSGAETINLLEENGTYDAVVLDLNLPDIDGVHLLKKLKMNEPHLPIMALTSRDTEEERVEGIKTGFDDYMVKPFSHHELAARLGVLLRSQPPPPPEVIDIGPLTIHPQSQIVLVNNLPVDLTLNEFRLLLYLARNRGREVSKKELLEAVWDRNSENNNAKIITTISRLRKKIGDSHKNII